jgi:hypothetical protein
MTISPLAPALVLRTLVFTPAGDKCTDPLLVVLGLGLWVSTAAMFTIANS